jgi:L-asparaginase
MRAPTQAGADGPANLSAALALAADPQADGLGGLVVMNDEVHAALWVTKAHASWPNAFQSPSTGRLGWIAEGRARIELRPVRRYPVLPFPEPFPRVDLLSFGFGAFDGQAPELHPDCQGLVLEAFGAGHVPEWLVEPLAAMAERIPVVFASATGAGATSEGTYGYPGSETDLIARGLIPAGPLTARKARLLLGTLLAAEASRERIAEVFAAAA